MVIYSKLYHYVTVVVTPVHVINFSADHDIIYIYKKQYGFRENDLTYMAIIDLVDKISSNIDNKKHSIGIFLDLSKAFDTIDHQILLRKLQRYGIRGIVIGSKATLKTESTRIYIRPITFYILYK